MSSEKTYPQVHLQVGKSNKDVKDPLVHYRIKQTDGQYHSSTIHSYCLAWAVVIGYLVFYLILLITDLRRQEITYSGWVRIVFFGFPAASCVLALLLKIPYGLGPLISVFECLRILLSFFGGILIIVAVSADVLDYAYNIKDYLKTHNAHKDIMFDVVFASVWIGFVLIFLSGWFNFLVIVLKKCGNCFEEAILTGEEALPIRAQVGKV